MKFFVFAPNVHCGGGLVLLKELIRHQPSKLVSKWFLEVTVDLELGSSVSQFEKGLWGRIKAEFGLYVASNEETMILCFHGAPTILPTRGRQLLYLQNALLVSTGSLKLYSYKTRIRLKIERIILKKRWKSIDLFFVQTETMKSAVIEFSLRHNLPKPMVSVLPFISKRSTKFTENSSDLSLQKKNIYFYPSLFQPHKNHLNLLKAWSEFVKSDPSLVLYLTVTQSDLDSLVSETNNWEVSLENVVPLGHISHEKVQTILKKSVALVFPSTIESFGLPLLEARGLNLPIIASELDFVRDVCSPEETFDPCSNISILRALQRFSGKKNAFLDIGGGEVFWKELMNLKY
jgi:glycosyltransferase involved in cell wall biosynthesis